MRFNVAAANNKLATYEGSYTIADSGVLLVNPKDAGLIAFSPTGWLALEVLDAPTSASEDHGLDVV